MPRSSRPLIGVNWIDTASVYGLGHSEDIVAKALAAWPGQRPYVFTKCGLRWDSQSMAIRKFTADSVRQECEDSLRRLRKNAIDLYQVHWPPVESPTELRKAGCMAALQREGKVRWIGVSNFDVAQTERAKAIAPITSLQPPYSLIRRDIETEVLPFCRKEKIGVIAYVPIASGLLTGAMTRKRAAKFPADDWRSKSPEFNEPNLTRNLALVELLRAVENATAARQEAAIAWTLRHPAVTGAIVGARMFPRPKA